jgi:hypothetical protein
MFVKSVTIHRHWHNGSDYIRHNFQVTHPVTSQHAQDEAMVAALMFWDPWQYGREIKHETAFNL